MENRSLSKKLTATEKQLLQDCEADIESGFRQQAIRIRTIRDQRLYREEFDTFEDYCRSRWSMSKSNANRLIESSKVLDRIQNTPAKANDTNWCQTNPTVPLPTHESQTRELAKAPEEEQAEVWQEVVDTTAKPTAKAIKAVVERKAAEKEGKSEKKEKAPLGTWENPYPVNAKIPESYIDREGAPVPEAFWHLWREVKPKYSRISVMDDKWEALRQLEELGKELGHQPTIDAAAELHESLSVAFEQFRLRVRDLQPAYIVDGDWITGSEAMEQGRVWP